MSDTSKVNISSINFSAKEKMVIQEFLTGAPYKIIAKKLNMSPSALEYHIRNIMNKTNCSSKTELMIFLNEQMELSKNKSEGIGNLKKIIFVSTITLLTTSVIIFRFFPRDNEQKTIAVAAEIHQFQEHSLERTEIVIKAMNILEKQKGIRTLAIVGEGGAGKTFLGRKILSQYNASIRWEINAETADSTYNSFFDLATRLAVTDEESSELERIKKIQSFDEKRKRLINFVSHFLHNADGWCLLFDNVDSVEYVRPYIPYNTEIFGKGSIIITTRDTEMGDVNFIKSTNVINIGHLSDTEQRNLFCNILYGKKFSELNRKTQNTLIKFLEKIPKMPLDVVAAAYYLKNTKISFDDYETIMQSSYRDLTGIQERLLEKNVNYNRTRYGIISSVFEEVLKQQFDFKVLLFTLCLLDSQNLPKRLLKMLVKAGIVDEFLYDLRKQSLIIDNGDIVSIHRSTQSIGLDYMINILNQQEKETLIKQLVECLCCYTTDQLKLLPHAEAMSEKLFHENLQDLDVRKAHIRLLLLIGDIHKQKTHKMLDALAHYQKALEINNHWDCLDNYELVSVKLKIGEIYTIINENTQADKYLNESLKFFTEDSMKKVRNFRLLGIVRMRQHKFEESNKYFIAALNTLKNAEGDELKKKLSESNIYEDMSFNYFMDGINRENAHKAVPLMEKAIEVLEDPKFVSLEEVVSRRAVHQIKLAGIHNALAHYQKALEIAQETENLLKKSGFDNSDTFYVQGLIARERGLSHLRLNKVAEAYDYFEKAREILTKLMTGDYLLKIKMHEAECLVRLNRLDEAFVACEGMFATKDRERNNYANLFFNTCYYHAAIIKYRQKDFEAAKKYFRKFFDSMKVFCKEIASKEEYDKLKQENAFNTKASIEDFFKNSLKVFEIIYWKDYEFTKYYVEKNIDLLKQ